MFIAWEIFVSNLRWMSWNLFLAVIPLALSLVLFKPQQPIPKNWTNLVWWLGVLVFILFLPNAAYITTDIIHLVDDIREPDISGKGLLLLIFPQYFCFMAAGFQCYFLSLTKLSDYLRRQNMITPGIWFELGINLLCAVGVYLGRFNRLNSWNVVTKPLTLLNTIAENLGRLNLPHFLFFTLLFFGVTSALFYLFKRVGLSFVARN